MTMGCAGWVLSSSSSSSRGLLPLLSRRCSIPLPAASHCRLRLSSAGHPSFSAARLKSFLRVVRCAQAKRGFASSREHEIASPADLCYDSPLKIVEYPDPILRGKNKRIDVFDDSLKKLVEEMFDIMYKTDGIGLSAPQVGINVQLMVFNPVGERGKGEEIVLVNPSINKYSKKTVLFNEGCLSFPGIYADVERPESVKVDARDVAGARFAVNLSGLPARVFQHEFDHLQGILFFERMTEEILESISANLEALEKRFEDKTGFPSPERIRSRKRGLKATGFGNREVKI